MNEEITGRASKGDRWRQAFKNTKGKTLEAAAATTCLMAPFLGF